MIKKEAGQSLVEFALVLPLLLMLVVGVFDFGRILYTHLNLELISQESVRLGGLGHGEAAIRSYAAGEFIGDASKLIVDVNVETDRQEGNRIVGDYVTVTLTYPESFLNILGDNSISYTVETSSTIRAE